MIGGRTGQGRQVVLPVVDVLDAAIIDLDALEDRAGLAGRQPVVQRAAKGAIMFIAAVAQCQHGIGQM